MTKNMLDSAMLKEDKPLLVARIKAKEEEIRSLINEINKKDAIINKMSSREQHLHKKVE